jgi:hypothetical protein
VSSREPALRVLFVTPVALELASGGGRTAAESFLEALRGAPIGAQVEVLPLQARRSVLPHRARQLVALVRSWVSSLPSKSLFHAGPGAIARVRRSLRETSCDLVVVNGGDLFFLLRDIPPSRARIGLALNVEHSLYEQQTKSLRGIPLLGRLFARDLGKLRRDEMAGLERLDGVVCLSRDDADAIRASVPGLPTLDLPTSFSYAPYARAADRAVGRPLRLGLVAKYGWWPNAEAVEWMIRGVLPGLTAGRVELHLYGAGAERFHGRHPSIVVHGYVPDLAEAWRETDIVVCPIVSGSGINVKLVEALYNGNPVLATSYAARGLPPLDDPAIVLLDSPEDWIRFLASDRAEALARTKPGAAISILFSTQSSAPRLAEFIDAVRARPAHAQAPRVTVITVCRDAAGTLQATFDSVAAQDYPGIEHIVIDGGSTDGTVDVIRKNSSRLASWTSEPDGGIYEAMNKGLAKATGDWVIFLNADDAFFDAHAVSAVFADPGRPWAGKRVVYGDSVMALAKGRTRLRRAKPLRTIRFKMPFTHQGVFVRAELLRERAFDTRYRLAGDYDFFREVYRRHGGDAFLDAGLCVNYFRVGGLSYRRLALKHREFLDIIRRHETGPGRAYCVALYWIRCLVPERLRDWLRISH